MPLIWLNSASSSRGAAGWLTRGFKRLMITCFQAAVDLLRVDGDSSVTSAPAKPPMMLPTTQRMIFLMIRPYNRKFLLT
jgi:hypothetical protein